MSVLKGSLTIGFVLLCLTGLASAQDVQTFYRGKQFKFIVSSSAGGGFDAYTRLIARHIQKHLPGSPTIVVQNMPGAGGIRAANYLYSVAPKDGTEIALFQNTVPLEPLYGNVQAQFEATKFQWLGSPSQETAVFAIWHSVPVNSIHDARNYQLIVGAPGVSSSPAFYARVFESIFDVKIKVLAGYKGASEALFGMEKRENDGNSSAYWSSLKSIRPDWITEKKIKFLFQYGGHPNPDLKGVPFALDLIKDPTKREMMEVAAAPLALGRPIAAPPGVPSERVNALRAALDATFQDPEYLADCAQVRLECDDPVSGIKVTEGLVKAYGASSEVVNELRRIYQYDHANK
jgi:tripartite-type tricarboxylate transporter receptor subunit TctC